LQVWNYSKLSAHEQIASGRVALPSRDRMGDQAWDQRVNLQPGPAASRTGKMLGGEVFLKLQYKAFQVCHAHSTILLR
jgi:hypothetical protein